MPLIRSFEKGEVVVEFGADEAADIGRFLAEEGNDEFGVLLWRAARKSVGWGDEPVVNTGTRRATRA